MQVRLVARLMERYQIILGYDGSEYRGFQRQKSCSEIVTVQGVVERALYRLGWQGERILAAGRTDTGVHATGQVIAFDFEWSHSTKDLRNAINALLPDDVVIEQVNRVRRSFHPRYDAITRCYRYRLFCCKVRQPTIERYAWRVWPEVNRVLIQQVVPVFLGSHDFSAFGKPSRAGGSTIRTVFSANCIPIEITSDILGWDFIICANGFLYHMIRRIVYYLVQVGLSKIDGESINSLLSNPSASPVQGLAPARGLTLVHVEYDANLVIG
jgi:tRNA pseudouridine38-40 synthase